MSEFSLRKAEKLCSRTAVDKLFASGTSAVAYPLRMVYQISDRSYGAPAQFMITIPKKKIRKAVGRVLLRRRIREAYRLNRQCFLPALLESGKKIDIAFIYMHKDADDYARIEQKMTKLLDILVTAVGSKEDEQSASSL